MLDLEPVPAGKIPSLEQLSEQAARGHRAAQREGSTAHAGYFKELLRTLEGCQPSDSAAWPYDAVRIATICLTHLANGSPRQSSERIGYAEKLTPWCRRRFEMRPGLGSLTALGNSLAIHADQTPRALLPELKEAIKVRRQVIEEYPDHRPAYSALAGSLHLMQTECLHWRLHSDDRCLLAWETDLVARWARTENLSPKEFASLLDLIADAAELIHFAEWNSDRDVAENFLTTCLEAIRLVTLDLPVNGDVTPTELSVITRGLLRTSRRLRKAKLPELTVEVVESTMKILDLSSADGDNATRIVALLSRVADALYDCSDMVQMEVKLAETVETGEKLWSVDKRNESLWVQVMTNIGTLAMHLVRTDRRAEARAVLERGARSLEVVSQLGNQYSPDNQWKGEVSIKGGVLVVDELDNARPNKRKRKELQRLCDARRKYLTSCGRDPKTDRSLAELEGYLSFEGISGF